MGKKVIMNKIVEYIKNNEKITKMVSSTVLFFTGVGVLFWGLSFCDAHFGICLVLSLLGILAGILGAIPLICFWTGWQNLND